MSFDGQSDQLFAQVRLSSEISLIPGFGSQIEGGWDWLAASETNSNRAGIFIKNSDGELRRRATTPKPVAIGLEHRLYT